MTSFFTWVEATWIASTVKNSTLLTGGLSAIHLLGFTLVTGGALVTNLRYVGALFSHRPVTEISGPATRGIAIGLAVSIATGVLLFAPRALAASTNGTFRLKMLLLALAATVHYAVHRHVSRAPVSPLLLRAAGAAGLALWVGLGLTACAYILLE